MKTYISQYDFRRAFQECRPDNFSYDGLKVLFEYLEEYEMDTGDELELDVIGLCCDFAESDWQTIASDYEGAIELDKEQDQDIQKTQVLDFLADQGVLIGETSDSIVYRQF